MKPEKPWYKQTATYVIGALVVISGAYALKADSGPTTQGANTANAAAAYDSSVYTQPAQAPQVTQAAQLSNNNSYTNVDGNTVHSPAYTADNSIPAGASAQCRDHTYSFSAHRSGTCSHHGGVARWL